MLTDRVDQFAHTTGRSPGRALAVKTAPSIRIPMIKVQRMDELAWPDGWHDFPFDTPVVLQD